MLFLILSFYWTGHIKTDHVQSQPASTEEEIRRRRIERFHSVAEGNPSTTTDQNDDNQERPA